MNKNLLLLLLGLAACDPSDDKLPPESLPPGDYLLADTLPTGASDSSTERESREWSNPIRITARLYDARAASQLRFSAR